MARLVEQLQHVMRRHLAGGRAPIPEAGIVFWNIFAEISASRTYHAAGPHPISHAEIEAYCRLHRWPLCPHHVAIIRALDNVWLEHAYSRMRGDTSKAPPRAHQKVTAAAFDAVFG